MLNISEGGAAFIKGGYGCIFRPAIGCVGQRPKLNYISKLLKNDHAKREYDYISKINSRLDKLPQAKINSPRQWTVNDWPDLTQMKIFKNK